MHTISKANAFQCILDSPVRGMKISHTHIKHFPSNLEQRIEKSKEFSALVLFCVIKSSYQSLWLIDGSTSNASNRRLVSSDVFRRL